MLVSIELPQCPICQDPFVDSESKGKRPMAPIACGHVFCKQCADACFKNYSSSGGREKGNNCPLCRSFCPQDGLIQLYLNFGRHDVHSSSISEVTGQATSGGEEKEPEVLLSVGPLSISDRGERAIRNLVELTTQRFDEWRPSRHEKRRQDTSAFHLVGSVVRDVAKNITGQESAKEILQRLAKALEDLQKWHTRAMQLAEDHARLRKRKEELKAELKVKNETYDRQLKDCEDKLGAQAEVFEEKQAELKRRLHDKCEELESERQKVRASEDDRVRLEEQVERWRRDSSKHKKRYELKKQELDKMKSEFEMMEAMCEPRHFEETSDSSLQVIEDDEDLVLDAEELELTPPTSSLTQDTSSLRGRIHEGLDVPSESSQSAAPRGRESPPRPSLRANQTHSAVFNIIQTKPKLQHTRPKREATLREPGRPKAPARILTMPVPSRKNTLSMSTNPVKKKRRTAIDID